MLNKMLNCVLPAPGGPDNSVILSHRSPPPKMRSNSVIEVTNNGCGEGGGKRWWRDGSVREKMGGGEGRWDGRCDRE